jgi:para-aminobenzoate synthetase component 1
VDEKHKDELRLCEKERAENVMIVDLMRNDLARCCEVGSINVDELFGIYSFATVHQMISTVIGKLKPNISFEDVLQNTFPMGSMTGAPKIESMKLIEQFETVKRGWYSGSIGYIAPNGDFDLNVVIRSLIYNTDKKYLSLQTGGAITIDSIAEKEYEESLLKAEAWMRLLA